MRSILLCVDGSNYAVSAAKYAINIAKLMDAHVDVLYVSDVSKFSCSAVADFGESLGVQPFNRSFSITRETEKQIAHNLDAKFKKMFIDEGLENRYKFNYRIGSFVYAIEEFKTNTTGLDLIILGKNGEDQKYNNTKIGDSIESVIRNSKIPCLIANKKFRDIKSMMVAYNGSDSCNKILHMIERNQFFKSIEIFLVSVGDNDVSKEKLDAAVNVLRDVAGINVVSEFLNGDVRTCIENFVTKNKIDLLAIGAYSHNIFSTLLFGSTTLSLIEDATVPVLVAD